MAGAVMGAPSPMDEARWCEEHVRRECVANRSRGRGQCHGVAMVGMPRCITHMGFAKALARSEGAANKAAWSVIAAMDLPSRDPATVVMAALEMTIMKVEVLNELLRLQVEDEDYGGLIGETRVAGRKGRVVVTGEQARALVQAEHKERELMVHIAAKAHSMGIEERVTEIAASQAQAVVAAYRASVATIVPALSAEQQHGMLTAFLEGLGAGPGPVVVGEVLP